MKTARYFLALFILNCFACNSQNNRFKVPAIDDTPIPVHYKWMGGQAGILTSMQLVYKKPRGFKEVSGYECFNEYPMLKEAFTCLPNQLQSNDHQFIAFMPAYKVFAKEDLVTMQSLFPGRSFNLIDKMHVNMIKKPIRTFLGEDAANNWKEHVIYYPENVVKEKFNADTVIRFTITLPPQAYYKKDFKYVDALFLQRKGRGFINFYCFYTDKAKERLDYYWKKIEGVLRYED